ncbi:MAG: hypothetical protein NVS3B15_11620 [Sediminibacterium sp.]
MTFEQGGHSRGGLAVVNEAGDTLTLTDRAMHHYTTGMSTIETTSENRQKLVSAFKQYFDDSRNGKVGEYKTYVLTAADENKLRSVARLLDQNGISYGALSNKNFKGYNYFSGKEENYADEGFHLAVSAYQPRSVMAKVLLEPKTKVVDSNTYDITAWSVPYAYGVKGYAVKEKLELLRNDWISATNTEKVNSGYGMLIPYTSFNAAQTLAYLLKQGIKVRYAEKPFTYNGKSYGRGTLIVLRTSNPANWNAVTNEACIKFSVQGEAVTTGFMEKGADFGSPDVKILNGGPKVAMLTGDQVSSLGAGEVWHYFEKILDYPVTLLNAGDLGRLSLKNYTVLILPDGYYKSLQEKPVNDKLKEFVRSGGKLIAIENAVSLLASGDWGIKAKEEKEKDKDKEDKTDYADLKKYGDRETTSLSGSIPGAIYKLELDNTHPLAFGYPGYYFTMKQDANLYEFLKDGWNVGVIKKDAYVTGFSGVKVKSKLTDGMLFGIQEMGNGHVVYLSDDPLFRNFWKNGELLFANAVFLVGE